MISYSCGKFDILRAEDLRNLDKLIQLSKEEGAKYFGVGVYDSKVCENLGTGVPLKSLEDRMKIMQQIIGIDFTFPIYSLDKQILEASAKESFKKHMEQKEKMVPSKKKYSTAYAPGSYDLFHARTFRKFTYCI